MTILFKPIRPAVAGLLAPFLMANLHEPSASAAPLSSARTPVALSEPRFRSYVLLAAASTCVLAEQKIPYELSLRSNATALYTVIRDVHGGQVDGMKSIPRADAFIRFLSFQISSTTLTVCRRQVPESYVRLVDATADLLRKKQLSPSSNSQ